MTSYISRIYEGRMTIQRLWEDGVQAKEVTENGSIKHRTLTLLV